jgi:hypothetical protein
MAKKTPKPCIHIVKWEGHWVVWLNGFKIVRYDEQRQETTPRRRDFAEACEVARDIWEMHVPR